MPVEVGIWRLGSKVERVEFSAMPDESRMETILADDISIIAPILPLIERQVPTDYGKVVDLLAMEADGNSRSALEEHACQHHI